MPSRLPSLALANIFWIPLEGNRPVLLAKIHFVFSRDCSMFLTTRD